MGFIKRTVCPCCKSKEDQKVLLEEYFNSNYFKHWIDHIASKPAGGYRPEVEEILDEKYEITKCGNCGLIYQSIIPDSELLHKAYESWYDQDENLRFNLSLDNRRVKIQRFLTEVYSFIQFYNQPVNRIKVMDFGMGWSEWSIAARSLGLEPIGLEISPSKVKYASSLGFEAQTLEQQEESSVDFINTEQVFEHLDEPFEYLQNLVRLLKPGGVVKLSVPNGSKIEENLKKYDFNSEEGFRKLNPVNPIEHLNCYNTESLVSLGKSCGLRPVELIKYDFQKSRKVFRPLNALKELARSIKHYNIDQFNKLNGPTLIFFQK
ncbi:class I SAM-dependent methyltransferase [Roseivirga misakiensis]|uniref:Methyltransferase type 11 n=1 Tax=Roseivirga misakiensis TaxID=1563681 RepID=A0A1E5T1H1_9BACT|nr:class I SAM-dependent methyltransferase [Roseivirga misakiensis]OEK05228.1 hypothetical protein BFP71_17655 [Roseivirga misakiensis]